MHCLLIPITPFSPMHHLSKAPQACVPEAGPGLGNKQGLATSLGTPSQMASKEVRALAKA